jgi:hypothetical protein
MKSEALDKAITWRELADWYIHWMNCSFSEIVRDIDRTRTEEDLVIQRDKIIALNRRFKRMLWEFVTIWGNDESEHELEKLLLATPKGIAFLKAKDNATSSLKNRWSQLSDAREGNFFMDLITSGY